ncbi:DUF4267 domain-containing protein [Kibdelosporangium persicum]|uniref:Small membrane hydrophobic protein n=1 Tax=Kibdelosporangium persicum TaxID=2698649 RepID=A0ABX2F4N8_9PSEU|nr:DUF4267 domain-containing protein [Kibdelosporangium persicum]NRN66304.1 Small membrane hydrophobic protein [Kibdelosporangium persicum]
MLTNVALVLAALIGVGIIVIGARVFWAPQAAAGFGIPGTPTEDRTFQAWLTVKGVRDIASGIFVFVLLIGGSPHLLGWFMLAATGIPVGDALIVLRNKGPKAVAYGVHASTAAVMLVISVLLLVA